MSYTENISKWEPVHLICKWIKVDDTMSLTVHRLIIEIIYW